MLYPPDDMPPIHYPVFELAVSEWMSYIWPRLGERTPLTSELIHAANDSGVEMINHISLSAMRAPGETSLNEAAARIISDAPPRQVMQLGAS